MSLIDNRQACCNMLTLPSMLCEDRLQPLEYDITTLLTGSSGSGVAQVLSVEDGHAQQAGESTMHHRSSGNSAAGSGGESHDRGKGNAKSGTKKGGVSLFGSFKAPMKRQ